jgi:hypothetical protein
MSKSNWKHTMEAGEYVGGYERDKDGERVFTLKRKKRNGKTHKVTYESHEKAKDIGWKKVK